MYSKTECAILKGTSCIYIFINKKRGMAYVGSAKRTLKRLSEHFNSNIAIKKNKTNICLQRSLKKSKGRGFVYGVLEWVPRLPSDVGEEGRIAHLKRLISREQAHLDHIPKKFRYNFDQIAGSRFGSKHSVATRLKISLSSKGLFKSAETKAAMSVARKGVLKSAETKAAMSVAKKGVPKSAETKTKISVARKGVLKSAETRAKMSEVHLNRSLEVRAKVNAATVAAHGFPVRLTNKEKGISFEAPSVSQAEVMLANYGTTTTRSTLHNYLKKKKLLKGWEVELLLRPFSLN